MTTLEPPPTVASLVDRLAHLHLADRAGAEASRAVIVEVVPASYD